MQGASLCRGLVKCWGIVNVHGDGQCSEDRSICRGLVNLWGLANVQGAGQSIGVVCGLEDLETTKLIVISTGPIQLLPTSKSATIELLATQCDVDPVCVPIKLSSNKCDVDPVCPHKAIHNPV